MRLFVKGQIQRPKVEGRNSCTTWDVEKTVTWCKLPITGAGFLPSTVLWKDFISETSKHPYFLVVSMLFVFFLKVTWKNLESVECY